MLRNKTTLKIFNLKTVGSSSKIASLKSRGLTGKYHQAQLRSFALKMDIMFQV